MRRDVRADEQMNENQNKRTGKTGECVQPELVLPSERLGRASGTNGQGAELSIEAFGDEVGW